MPSSISDRLKALGVKVGTQDIKPVQQPAKPQRLEEILGGEWIQTPQGAAFVVEQRFPSGHPHGTAALRLDAPLEELAVWAGDARIGKLAVDSIAFLDTETTGLSGGTGTYAFLIGVGRFCNGEFILQQILLGDPASEQAQLAALEAFLAPCQAVVTYNGKTFDIPLLVTRFTAQGLIAPFRDLAHIDLLHLARRLWRERIPSRTLVNLEYQILGTTRGEQDIPGWMIPSIYFNFLHDGNPDPLRGILYHNAMDVLSLTALLDHMAWMLADPLAIGGRYGIDLIALAKLFEDLGDLDRATQLYIHGLEHEDARTQQMPVTVLLQALDRLAQIRKHQHDLDAAIQLWQHAAIHCHLEAHVELAKVYEHQLKDLQQAIRWTETALDLVDNGALLSSAYQKRQWMVDLQHRLDRLKRKLQTAL